MDSETAASEDREKTAVALAAALTLSVAMHAILMFALRTCSFGEANADIPGMRKWTRDVPSMHVTRHAGDPLAEAGTAGTASAAPVNESVQERVARLADPPDGASAAPVHDPALQALAAAAAAPSEAPPPVSQEAMAPQDERPAVLDHPVAEPDAPAPRKVQDAQLPVPVADIPPPAAPPPPPMPSAADPAGAAADLRGHPSLPEPPAPPDASAFGFVRGGRPHFGAEAAYGAPESEKPPAPDTDALSSGSAGLVMPRVDEAAVAREKKAVAALRDNHKAEPFAKHVRCELAHWDDTGNPGTRYFRLRISSNPDNRLDVVAKDVVYLLDASGSIANDRLKSCRKAVSEALRNLNSNDRFNIVAFRDKFTYLFGECRAVDADSLAAADKWLGKLAAHGRTDVFGTLRSVLAVPRSPARPLIALAVTDGEPTSGLTRSSEIISAFSELNDGLVSMYMYGVKEDANAYLMDMLTRQNRGEWSRHSGMRWRAASGIPAMAERFRDPMLSDISVAFAAASRVEAYPGRVPNLYAAAPVTIYGKCPADVKELVFAIRGLNGAQAMEDVFRLGFAAKAELGPELAKSWAQQRVYALAGRYARRPDAETMREMRNFAARFGVDVPEDGEQGKKR